MLSEVTTTWAGEELTLFPDRALLWNRTQSLIIADPHFGKAATFRAAGIAIPEGTTGTDLLRLDALLSCTGARRLLILGDFFHAAPGRADGGSVSTALGQWRTRHSDLEIVLIRGNHDLHAGDPPEEWNIRIVPETLNEYPFLFCHDRDTQEGNPDHYVMSGHIHPAVRLRDRTGAGLCLPCFHFGRRSALLPAFGSFTGNAVIRPRPGDQVFVIGEDTIVEIPTRKAACQK